MDGDGHEVNARAIFNRVWRMFRWLLLRATAARGKRRPVVLVLSILALVTWQYSFSLPSAKIDARYKNQAASGMHNDQFFVYFFWYTGLFPVASTLRRTRRSRSPCPGRSR